MKSADKHRRRQAAYHILLAFVPVLNVVSSIAFSRSEFFGRDDWYIPTLMVLFLLDFLPIEKIRGLRWLKGSQKNSAMIDHETARQARTTSVVMAMWCVAIAYFVVLYAHFIPQHDAAAFLINVACASLYVSHGIIELRADR